MKNYKQLLMGLTLGFGTLLCGGGIGQQEDGGGIGRQLIAGADKNGADGNSPIKILAFGHEFKGPKSKA